MVLFSSYQIAKQLNLAHSTVRGYIAKKSIKPQQIQRSPIFSKSLYPQYTRIYLYDMDSVLSAIKPRARLV